MKWSGRIHWKRFIVTNPKTWPTPNKPVLFTYKSGNDQFAYMGHMTEDTWFIETGYEGDSFNPVWFNEFAWAYVDRPLWWDKSKASINNKNSRRSQ